MKKYLLSACVLIGFSGTSLYGEKLSDKVKFASLEKAKELLLTPDDFTTAWSQFDIDSRMGKKGSTKEALFEFISDQTLEWSPEEKNTITTILEEIDQKIKSKAYKIELPEEIYLVKTTAKEEGGAMGYTRGNYIVLKAGAALGPKQGLTNTLVHELFHVFSRNNPEFRKEMYEIIGFELMPAADYPDELKAFRITNPDAPLTDSYIRLEVNGKDANCMMILYSEKEYDGGPFFNYLKIGFLDLKSQKVYQMNEVKGFLKQVGKNTQYIINPEEIMAMNFSFALLGKKDLQDIWVVEEIEKKLQE